MRIDHENHSKFALHRKPSVYSILYLTISVVSMLNKSYKIDTELNKDLVCLSTIPTLLIFYQNICGKTKILSNRRKVLQMYKRISKANNIFGFSPRLKALIFDNTMHRTNRRLLHYSQTN